MNYRLRLFLLARLEQEPLGLSTEQLCRDADDAGLEGVDLRQVQRYLKDLREQGVPLERYNKKNVLTLPQNPQATFEAVRDCFSSVTYKKILYGEFVTSAAVRYFEKVSGGITLLYTLSETIFSGQTVYFNYIPQTEETRKKLLERSLHTAIIAETMPVLLLPHYLVVSLNSFLVLGEYFEKKSLTTNSYDNPLCRQYELCGIRDLRRGDITEPKLTIDPRQLYRNSVYVWVGGHEYSLTLEELHTDGKTIRQLQRTVNGENEILSMVLASLGRIRIVNPPEPIINRARELGLPFHLVFRFTENHTTTSEVR